MAKVVPYTPTTPNNHRQASHDLLLRRNGFQKSAPSHSSSLDMSPNQTSGGSAASPPLLTPSRFLHPELHDTSNANRHGTSKPSAPRGPISSNLLVEKATPVDSTVSNGQPPSRPPSIFGAIAMGGGGRYQDGAPTDLNNSDAKSTSSVFGSLYIPPPPPPQQQQKAVTGTTVATATATTQKLLAVNSDSQGEYRPSDVASDGGGTTQASTSLNTDRDSQNENVTHKLVSASTHATRPTNRRRLSFSAPTSPEAPQLADTECSSSLPGTAIDDNEWFNGALDEGVQFDGSEWDNDDTLTIRRSLLSSTPRTPDSPQPRGQFESRNSLLSLNVVRQESSLTIADANNQLNGNDADPSMRYPIPASMLVTSPSMRSVASGSSVATDTVTRTNTGKRLDVYSAIGSLENPTAESYGSLRKRILEKQEKKKGFGKLLVPAKQSSLSAQMKESPPVKKVSPKESSLSVQMKESPPPQQQSAELLPQAVEADGSKLKSNLKATSKYSARIQNDPASETAQELPQPNDQMPKQKTSPPRTVSYGGDVKMRSSRRKKRNDKSLFRPSSDAYTPRTERKKIEYKPAEKRSAVHKNADPLGTLQRPNFRDALRRVAMIIHQHIVKIEERFQPDEGRKAGLFKHSMKELFCEDNYRTPTYKCTMVRIPMASAGMVYGLRKIKTKHQIPSENEIYEFAHQLFHSVQLSSECSIVCLIYVERLMEVAEVPLMACTWRPIFMCGLLLASKVWQDLSSWNVEFASVYPQYSRDAINKLELNFLRMIKWDLYIGSSLYAKYYFALRALVERRDFRQRYNRMVGGPAHSEALKIQQRTEVVKEEAILQLSRSM